ncbi:PREDICTED: UDP-glycosyltransferase 87A1-like [Nicotiana attenuata]|uniref:UDP-glycosyltransferase g18508 n=1 Tax=Nicotiana attenuata TaxID=49451 RepID=A0A2I2MNE8_NICAT|nr:PREDICTED: UDP-glycosyltransferase 87A1-like [Nicotiana attenuata]AQQ16658.1 UDP-glycosyltransferase g18508 [Nicotiana attenuata]OIT32606.1 udp-glycosyltransferase 87a2 [Nicotiana attenuata]
MELPSQIKCHIVAIPYPGRGHINPMMNFCKLIVTKHPNILITFIVTEEWYSFINSDPLPENIKYATIPNVIPSEIGRAKDFAGFFRATLTKLEAPVEKLIDGLGPLKPSVIVYDTYMSWVTRIGSRRNIPVASFFPMSATVFDIFHHMDLLAQNGHLKANLSGKLQEQVDYIPGIPLIRVLDLPTLFHGKGQELLDVTMQIFSTVSKAQYLLFTSVYGLESSVIDALKQKFTIPVYPIGPAIPYFTSEKDPSSTTSVDEPEYIKWLNAQPNDSVLYISQGSFLSVSRTELDEIVAGVHDSGVRFFWVARDETVQFQNNGCSEGLVVPWCDQLKVLSHPSIGGFWSHCGWNSTKEAAFSGLPMLTFPIFWDQQTNSKQIVEDWKIGYRVKKDDKCSITRGEISSLLKWFMDSGNDEVMETRRSAKEIQKICQCSTVNGGSSEINIDAFVKDVSSHKFH